MRDDANLPAPQGEFLIYQTEDGHTRVQVRFERDTVWLSQRDMTQLFQTSKQNISLHIQNVFEEGELVREGTVKEYLTVQTEGNRQVERRVEHYNLDVIISVGYRVKSLRGTQFRIWATQRLNNHASIVASVAGTVDAVTPCSTISSRRVRLVGMIHSESEAPARDR